MASWPCYEATCQYKHCCPFCNAKHPVTQCYRPNYRSNNNRSQPSGFAKHHNFLGHGMAPMNRNWHNNDLYISGLGFLNIEKNAQFLPDSGPHFYDPVIKGLGHGFSLGYEGPNINIHLDNLKPDTTKPEMTKQLLGKEILVGRIIGPFSEPPFSKMRINPVGLVSKKKPNEFRLITDLSQPSGMSVNDFIPQSESVVSYPTVQSAIDIIIQLSNQRKIPIISKVDVKWAFSLVPLSPDHFPLVSLSFESMYSADKFLPIGASSSCKIYQQFSDAISVIAQKHFGIKHMITWLLAMA